MRYETEHDMWSIQVTGDTPDGVGEAKTKIVQNTDAERSDLRGRLIRLGDQPDIVVVVDTARPDASTGEQGGVSNSVSAIRAADIVREKIEQVEDELDDLADEKEEKSTCPHCGRDMEAGRVDSQGNTKYGCYPDGDREDYDCPYYQEHRYSYTHEPKRLNRKLSKAQRRKSVLEGVLDAITVGGDA